jgi:Putative zinc-finger
MFLNFPIRLLKCRKTQKLLALLAGNDLDEASQVDVRRHLAVCPDCRAQWQGLQAGQQTLEQVRARPASASETPPSIWGDVHRLLGTTTKAPPPGASWRGWLPAGALAAACLVVGILIFDTPYAGEHRTLSDSSPPISPQPVGNGFASGPVRFMPPPLRRGEPGLLDHNGDTPASKGSFDRDAAPKSSGLRSF